MSACLQTRKNKGMTPLELMATIYLGDRACKAIIIESWQNRVLVQVDCLSRIRDPSGRWNFYTDEDIEDAYIVLTGVNSVALEPPGRVPDDYFLDWRAEIAKSTPESSYRVIFDVASSGEMGPAGNVVLTVIATGMHLEDPKRPGKEIRQ